MKLHIVTIGQPHLAYAKQGWEEYFKRLGHYHDVRVTHLQDKFADDTNAIMMAAGSAYKIILEITGREFTSEELSIWLEKRALSASEIVLIIGGPNGLPSEVRASADLQWSLGRLTLPHDLAMVVTLEALYRASTIAVGHPYHRA